MTQHNTETHKVHNTQYTAQSAEHIVQHTENTDAAPRIHGTAQHKKAQSKQYTVEDKVHKVHNTHSTTYIKTKEKKEKKVNITHNTEDTTHQIEGPCPQSSVEDATDGSVQHKVHHTTYLHSLTHARAHLYSHSHMKTHTHTHAHTYTHTHT